MMDVRDYVESLLARYDHSAGMEDFKEEVCSNLSDRIQYLQKNGLSPEEAFAKATSELGDISEIAEQIGKEKRQEAFEDMYMKTRSYLKKWQVIAYLVAGGLMAFGIIRYLLVWLNFHQAAYGIRILIPFIIIPACAFVFLGLRQETARNYPMPWKRAAAYTASAALILFGLMVFLLRFFVWAGGLAEAVATLIPFVLPGTLLLVFLLLTEKSRNKPWVKEQQAVWERHMQDPFDDPYTATRFGLFSGALWLLAAALFIALGFWLGFRYSWLVFLFAVAAQLLIQARMTVKK